ncbi:hypothetical protein GCM10010094_24060 [Streptomyces flaveus]|uniref:Uncharacterized protein n=1 Tax=Streptomyces flaveus TaxID=66370 RepID=A0A917QQ33_9ACTN|nr:hypothetical protein GCM10010094_24060 [Streptomyces flaveus]
MSGALEEAPGEALDEQAASGASRAAMAEATTAVRTRAWASTRMRDNETSGKGGNEVGESAMS